MIKITGSSNLAPRELETNEVVGGGGRAMETVVDPSKLSKNRRIVKKSKKPQRLEKLQRSSVWRNVHQSPNLWLIWHKELELPLNLWLFFKLFFARPRSSLDTTFGAIIVMARLIELLMLYRVFPPEETKTKKKSLDILGTSCQA